jgi:DNA polymerase epsilon subunit 1
VDHKDELEFEIVHFEELEKLNRKLNSFINKISEERPIKPLLVVQSPNSKQTLKSLKALNDFPLIQMKTSEAQLPAIGWQSIVLKRVCNHFLSLPSWIKHLRNLARYSNVPLCNLKVDDIGYLVDIEYARRLKKNNIVLWWSP